MRKQTKQQQLKNYANRNTYEINLGWFPELMLQLNLSCLVQMMRLHFHHLSNAAAKLTGKILGLGQKDKHQLLHGAGLGWDLLEKCQ